MRRSPDHGTAKVVVVVGTIFKFIFFFKIEQILYKKTLVDINVATNCVNFGATVTSILVFLAFFTGFKMTSKFKSDLIRLT